MKKTILYLIAAGTVSMATPEAQAQGISNARDGSGNLLERGAATRTYPSAPMANRAVVPAPIQGYVAGARHRTVVIAPRR